MFRTAEDLEPLWDAGLASLAMVVIVIAYLARLDAIHTGRKQRALLFAIVAVLALFVVSWRYAFGPLVVYGHLLDGDSKSAIAWMSRGVDVEARIPFGDPLFWVTSRGHPEVRVALLRNGFRLSDDEREQIRFRAVGFGKTWRDDWAEVARAAGIDVGERPEGIGR
jgi:hypothetical protein